MRAITTPPARLIGGSLFEGRATKQNGEPYVYKTGAKKGQPYKQMSFGVAVPKGTEKHWRETKWGAEVWAEGAAGSPNKHTLPSFSWKITDGDSDVPNKAGNKPRDQEGQPGCWVIWFQANDFVVPCYNANGTARLEDITVVKPGYWIQVRFQCDFNGQTDSPGVYLEQKMVAFSAPGEEIILRVAENPAEAGFGSDPLPPGVSATPVDRLNETATSTSTTITPAPDFLADDEAPPIPDDDLPPPVPDEFPPEGWKAHPAKAGWYYKGKEVMKEADLRALAG